MSVHNSKCQVLFIVMLNVSMLCLITLNVVMLSVVALLVCLSLSVKYIWGVGKEPAIRVECVWELYFRLPCKHQTRHQFHQHVYANLFAWKTKKLLVFENKFHHAFLYKNCAGCAICKLHLAVLVAICKSQLTVHKKALKKLHVKNDDEIDPRSK
jgi:hypothetical protein